MHIHNLGINMNDDNEAVEENMTVANEVLFPNEQKLGWNGIFHLNQHKFIN